VSAVAAAAPLAPPQPALRVGRAFVHPLFDVMLIGGGLSLIVSAMIVWGQKSWLAMGDATAVTIVLLANLAHFASSTVRLYTKPGAFRDYRFLTMGLPLVTLATLTLALLFADAAGSHLLSLYLTWSPFHYGAQAYGLAVMYCYRSGLQLSLLDRRLIRTACLMPFAFTFVNGPASGLPWLAPWLMGMPTVEVARQGLVKLLGFASLLLPLVVYGRSIAQKRSLPLISALAIASNAVWLIVLLSRGAFWWAAVFHGLQYLAIVTIFHVRDRQRVATQPVGWLWPTVTFYGSCVLLGYLLFKAWPYAYVMAGFGMAESMLLVIAAINIHHFVVDAFIWKLRRGSNAQTVNEAAPVTAAA
jgi:hypothetical protein